MTKYIFILLNVFLLIGCSGQEPPRTTNIAKYSAPTNSQETVRHIITRDKSLLYIMAKAKVFVNGKEVGKLGRGKTISVNAPVGQTVIKVGGGGWGMTGTSSAQGITKIGNTYKYTISPRSEILWKSSACAQTFLMCQQENSGIFAIVPQQ